VNYKNNIDGKEGKMKIPFEVRCLLIALLLISGTAIEATTPVSSANLKPGDEFQDCVNCPAMVVLPAGSFIMGSPETEKNRDKDEIQHKVTIAYSFAASKYPITWDQWEACVRDAMCDGIAVEAALRIDPEGKPIEKYKDHGRGDHPVVGISWYDAQVFVGWLNRKTGQEEYRLMTEAEFEYAARAGTTTAYWWGDEPSHDYANYGKGVGEDIGGLAEGPDIWDDETSPVGSFPPNPFGLYDMYGNVFQWIEDCYETDVKKMPADGSAVKSGDCFSRGFRGNTFISNEHTLRSANRAFQYPPNTRGRNYLGFRVAKTLYFRRQQ
jgi:formylglycine-generating enzyme required for sulfatase activity